MELDTVHLGDCLPWLRSLPDGCCDAVVADPPYGVGIAEWDVAPTEEFRDECLRITSGPVVLFGAAPIRSVSAFIKLDPDRMLVWAPKFTLSRTAANGLFYRFHLIWVWRTEQLVGADSDVLTHSLEGHNWWNHACTKPVALMKALVNLTAPGGTVCDPFMGSGTTAVACIETGRHFIGAEISPEYHAIAMRRIAEARARPRLPGLEPTPQQYALDTDSQPREAPDEQATTA